LKEQNPMMNVSRENDCLRVDGRDINHCQGLSKLSDICAFKEK
jgi:hypothetical protein